MSELFEIAESGSLGSPRIVVFGVGGGGCNSLNHMQEIQGVERIAANTDVQALKNSNAPVLLELGQTVTKGLGAGANPKVGKQAAEENREAIREILQGADMVFITAGMGGGTGTGAAPVIAQIAKETGALTIAVVTKPFLFEGKKRMQLAEEGISELSVHVDSLIVIPNNKLLSVLGKGVTLLNAFQAANNVLLEAVKGISGLITETGLVNVDYADVKTVMTATGRAMMGSGVSIGENRAREAAEAAISSPLLEDIDLSGAEGVLINITAGLNMSIGELEAVGEVVKSFASEYATVVVGTVIDPEMTDELRVTVVVTGLGGSSGERSPQSTVRETLIERKTMEKEPDVLDYRQLDRPTLLRQQKEEIKMREEQELSDKTMDYFEIPAFLRKEEEQEV